MFNLMPDTLRTDSSSWLAGMRYDRGNLAIATRDGRMYVYSGVPPWVPGLIMAHRSRGRAFGLLVRGKYKVIAKEQCNVE